MLVSIFLCFANKHNVHVLCNILGMMYFWNTINGNINLQKFKENEQKMKKIKQYRGEKLSMLWGLQGLKVNINLETKVHCIHDYILEKQ